MLAAFDLAGSKLIVNTSYYRCPAEMSQEDSWWAPPSHRFLPLDRRWGHPEVNQMSFFQFSPSLKAAIPISLATTSHSGTNDVRSEILGLLQVIRSHISAATEILNSCVGVLQQLQCWLLAAVPVTSYLSLLVCVSISLSSKINLKRTQTDCYICSS